MRAKLIRIFQNSSIRAKLSLLVVLNGSLALALVDLFLLTYQNLELRAAAARELSIETGIVADSSTAELSFADERAGTETVTPLRGDPNLQEAAIYDSEDHLFAWYERSGPSSADRLRVTFSLNPLFDPLRERGGRVPT